MGLSESLIIGIIAGSTALLSYIAKLIYSSKCVHIKCGCIEIDRNTSQEVNVNTISENRNNISLDDIAIMIREIHNSNVNKNNDTFVQFPNIIETSQEQKP